MWDRLVKEKCTLGEEMMSLNMGNDQPVGRTPDWRRLPKHGADDRAMVRLYAREAAMKPEHEVYDTGNDKHMQTDCRIKDRGGATTHPVRDGGENRLLPTMKSLVTA